VSLSGTQFPPENNAGKQLLGSIADQIFVPSQMVFSLFSFHQKVLFLEGTLAFFTQQCCKINSNTST